MISFPTDESLGYFRASLRDEIRNLLDFFTIPQLYLRHLATEVIAR